MLKKLLLLTIFGSTLHAHRFEFADNKKDGSLNKSFIKKLVDIFHCNIFFETGTYDGGTTINATPYFEQVYTVELFKKLYETAKVKFAPYKQIKLFYGKSPEIIAQVGPSLSEKNVLFWLDAHYSGPGTALSNPNESDPEAVTAIRGELASIQKSGIKNCTILIDDIRGFGTEFKGKEFLGCWAYPTLQEVKKALLEINPHFEIALLGDTLLAYDAAKYQPEFSPTVLACTKTRLYDGYSLTDEELAYFEKSIMQAPTHEKAFIKHLYELMTQWKDPMFWHDAWYGLSELGNNNLYAAREALSKIGIRVQFFTQHREADNTVLHVEHPHLKSYLELCK